MSLTSSIQLPTCIGNYLIVKILGRGSFGEVYEVSKEGQGYAIKRVDGDDKTAATELAFATKFSATVNSHFLVKYYETIRGTRNELYVVMELCMQGDLKALLDRIRKSDKDATLNPSRIIKILIQLLLGVDALHRSMIIHRDLKPDNVFVDADDNIKIGDFGCARLLESLTDKAHTCIGTPLYESPEVVKGEDYTLSSDLWSLGVLLYELCTLARPFKHPNRYVLQQIIMSGKYKPIPKLRAPKEIRAIVDSLLQTNPKDRPTAHTLLQDPYLQEYAEEFNLLNFFPSNAEKQKTLSPTIPVEQTVQTQAQGDADE